MSMMGFHEQYVVDEHGNRSAVLVPLSEWQRLLDELEELDEIREYDEAKKQLSETVGFEQAIREIREGTVP
jgi:PHD/YefM family antitoxin component YafN of YafNO toxin-antitoxin module